MQKEIDLLQRQNAIQPATSSSIDRRTPPSTDARLTSLKDMLQSFKYKLDGVYYLLNEHTDGLTTSLDALKQDVGTIQRQIDFQTENFPSIDRRS